jgi:hypothetical protein
MTLAQVQQLLNHIRGYKRTKSCAVAGATRREGPSREDVT